eukprot:12425316-Alexandrium_andersonii.AAC.1
MAAGGRPIGRWHCRATGPPRWPQAATQRSQWHLGGHDEAWAAKRQPDVWPCRWAGPLVGG